MRFEIQRTSFRHSAIGNSEGGEEVVEKKEYALLAEWGRSNCLIGLFPRIVECSAGVKTYPNTIYLTFAYCREEAIENFIKIGRIKRRSQSAIVEINGKQQVSFFAFTDCIKRLAR